VSALLMDPGAAQVRADVIGFLRGPDDDGKPRLEAALESARGLWGITELSALPPPARWNEYEDEVVGDETPSIALALGRSRGYAREGYGDAMEQQYRVRHEVRLFAWLKAGGADPKVEQQPNPSQRMRDQYAQVIAAVLLDRPSLGQPGIYSLDEGTMVLDYSVASRVRGDRYLSGVSVTFDLYRTETLRRVPLGSVIETEVAATVQVGTQD
jgi:hypothetical protein